MADNSFFENAINRMKLFVEDNPIIHIQGANEAKTRLLVIDEVLSILGWSKHEYEPEHVTRVGTYTDYRLTIDGQPRLIVEAKRVGLIAPLPKSIQRPDYTNSFLYTNYGSEMNMLLRQCQDYCVQCGIPYALATTGGVWIILIGFKHGVEWGKLKSFVFHSLEDIYQRFGEFYGLVSREAIKQNSLDERFGSMVLIKPNFVFRPREHVHYPPPTGYPSEWQVIRAFFDQFMGDITHPEQAMMLEQCYVEDHQLHEFSRELQRIIQYDAVLDELDLPIQKLDELSLTKALDLQTGSSNPKTILLVGNVGSGKSTFVHRFIRHTARPQQHICTVVDLIDQATLEISPDRAEEQRLAQLVLDKIAQEFQGKFDPYSLEVLRGCFAPEVSRFRKQMKSLFEYNLEQYRIQEEAYIFELTKDTYKHLTGYIKYARHKRYKMWITFDNVDRGSDSYQQFVYSFAHHLAASAECTTLITLRQDTFLEAQEAGFLDVRTSDIVFQITPPEFRRIISKRRKYIDRIIENSNLPKQFRPHTLLLRLINWHIKRLVLDEDDSVRLFITSFSLNNIRYGLILLRDSYLSFHSTFHEFYHKHYEEIDFNTHSYFDYKQELSHFIATLMLRNNWKYHEETSPIFNVFSVDPLEKISHFLMLRILAYLSLERNTVSSRMSMKYDKICNDFIFLGYQRHHINNAIRKLLYAGLIISPNLPANPVTEAKVEVPDPLSTEIKVALSARGLYYLRKLASHPYYQMRVAEDTIWYNEEFAQLYTQCLQENANVQEQDLLEATDAREIFINYLKRALFEETQNSNLHSISKDWVRIVNDIVERSIFGESVTKSDYIGEIDGAIESDNIIVDQKNVALLPLKPSRMRKAKQANSLQLKLFEDDYTNQQAIDYDKTIQEAVKSFGQMPKGIKLQKSEYVVRVLWALEIAFRAGLGSLRATNIAMIIQEYGQEAVTASSVAHFFQNQRSSGEHNHLWKEEPKRCYTISTIGRHVLTSLLETENVQDD